VDRKYGAPKMVMPIFTLGCGAHITIPTLVSTHFVPLMI
jgi:hypothetical protein